MTSPRTVHGPDSETVRVQDVVLGCKIVGPRTLPSAVRKVQCVFAAGSERGGFSHTVGSVVGPPGVHSAGWQRQLNTRGGKEGTPICWKGAARILDDVPVPFEDARVPNISNERKRSGNEWPRARKCHQPYYQYSLHVPFCN